MNTPQHLVDRSDPSEVFLKARNVAGTFLQEMMDKASGGQFNARDDFKWIKHELTHPSFDDLTFTFKNKVFSVVIELIDGKNSLLSQQDRDRFSEATTEHNLVACLFKIQLDSMQPSLDTLSTIFFISDSLASGSTANLSYLSNVSGSTAN